MTQPDLSSLALPDSPEPKALLLNFNEAMRRVVESSDLVGDILASYTEAELQRKLTECERAYDQYARWAEMLRTEKLRRLSGSSRGEE